MNTNIIYIWLLLLICGGCNNQPPTVTKNDKHVMIDSTRPQSNYANVNGIKLYYETYGAGEPLVLLHGGGSTIQSSFGRLIPHLAMHYNIIAVDLQNHGRSGFREIPETFEQDADDIASLLTSLKIPKAAILGFSNGGTTALQIAIRHPQIVNRLVLIACAYKRSGFIPGFFESMQHAMLDNMPKQLQQAFLEVNNDTAKLQIMFEKDRDRMIAFKDIEDGMIKSITKPTLVVNGDKDVVVNEHAVELSHAIKGAELAIIPGIHGECIGELTTLSNANQHIDFMVAIIRTFLSKPALQ